jgi:hypothetical protein
MPRLLRRPQFAADPTQIGGKLERISFVAFDAAQHPWSFALERRLKHHWRAATLASFGVILAHDALWRSEDYRAIPFFVIILEDCSVSCE